MKNTLQTMMKSSLTIHEYFRKMKDVIDALITSSQTISKSELVGFILDGIGQEFDLVVVYITLKLDVTTGDITLGDAKVILQRYKWRFAKHSIAYVFYIYEGSMNIDNRVVGRDVDGRVYRNQRQGIMLEG